MDETMSKLDSYFEGLKARGEKMPRLNNCEAPSYVAIAKAAGIDYECFKSKQYKDRIKLALNDIGLEPIRSSEN
jgi:hypothetical protein